jgi:hypothetical protein
VGSLLKWDVGGPISAEKDRLLECFFSFVQTHLIPSLPPGESGPLLFFDYLDPCSGLPMISDSNRIYDEVESFCALLSYPSSQAGGCKVFTHPRYGEGGYPATCFVKGRREDVEAWMGAIVRQFGSRQP